MTEINELAAPPKTGKHPNDDPNCPFCPIEEEKETWTTHAKYGANDSEILGDLMLTPGKLVSRQGGARPKTEKAAAARQVMEVPALVPLSPVGPFGPYSFEAHHLISGNHALCTNPIKAWLMSADGVIDGDTGYSVNTAANGVWLPSVPTIWVKGGFGACTQKYVVARVPMAEGLGQFHKGNHHIVDHDDPDQKHHGSYNTWLNARLAAVAGRIGEWPAHCPVSIDRDASGKKPKPSVRVHDVLDAVSTTMRGKVGGTGHDWHIFVSKMALWYHKELTEGASPATWKTKRGR